MHASSSSNSQRAHEDAELADTPHEQQPLLTHRRHGEYGSGVVEEEFEISTELEGVEEFVGEPGLGLDKRADHHASTDDLPHEKRQLGFMSAAFLIFNRVIGTGIFATPSVILRSSGSVGMSLVMWLLGAIVAACGTAVYIELGTGLPRSGGEKNYLDFIYRRPQFLAICVYASFALLVGWESASCSVFGEYVLHAIDPTTTPSPAAARFVSLLGITFAFLLHGTHLNWGLRVQNTLGACKFLVLIGIAVSGLAALLDIPGFRLEHKPKNLEWSTMWQGSGSGGTNAFVTGLYNVIWSFIGYSNANYALSEIKNPVRTIKLAAPIAMISITIVYMLVTIAYYAVVDKDDILGSGRIVAALFFGRLWGVWTERVLSAIVAISTLGNVLAVLFTHGRVIQELGREGVIPFSSFFASNKPFDAPLAGLFSQYFVTSLLVTTVPPGDAYLFMLNSSTYPLSIINALVSGGLLLLRTSGSRLKSAYEWKPPFHAYYPVIACFFLSNVFLVFAPLIPPAAGFRPYAHLPYWLHVFSGFAIGTIGVIYWYVSCRWLPARRGYQVIRERVVQEDGVARSVMKKLLDQ